jgi:hypothetical protein
MPQARIPSPLPSSQARKNGSLTPKPILEPFFSWNIQTLQKVAIERGRVATDPLRFSDINADVFEDKAHAIMVAGEEGGGPAIQHFP